MLSIRCVAILLVVLVGRALAVTHTVTVGGNGAKTYEPNQVKADLGDIVNFVFAGGNHTVTQSTFADPCNNVGFKSGFRPAANSSSDTFAIMINSTQPIWVYCAQTGHCQSGMVMAINAAESGDKTFAAFQQFAMGGGVANGSTTAPTPSGSGGIIPDGGSTASQSVQPSASASETSTTASTGSGILALSPPSIGLLGLAGVYVGFLY